MREIEQGQETAQLYDQTQQNEGIMRLRLDPDPIIRNFVLLLRGQEIQLVKNENTGEIFPEPVQVSKPLCNEIGVHRILYSIRNTINTQTIQGNFSDEAYEAFMCEAHCNFATMLFNNSEKYDLTTEDFDAICDNYNDILTPYFTRLLYNKERDSYGTTHKSVEKIGNTRESGGFNLFRR